MWFEFRKTKDISSSNNKKIFLRGFWTKMKFRAAAWGGDGMERCNRGTRVGCFLPNSFITSVLIPAELIPSHQNPSCLTFVKLLEDLGHLQQILSRQPWLRQLLCAGTDRFTAPAPRTLSSSRSPFISTALPQLCLISSVHMCAERLNT